MKRALTLLGYAFSILPAALSTLEFFPLWASDREKSISLFALVLLALAFLPLYRLLRHRLRTPSAWMLWLVFFLFLSLFHAVIDELRCIALIALVGSLVGALLFWAARRVGRRE